MFGLASGIETDQNELHIVQYHEESNKITLHQKYEVKNGAVQALAASPFQESLLAAAHD
jgi:hypothetical protein